VEVVVGDFDFLNDQLRVTVGKVLGLLRAALALGSTGREVEDLQTLINRAAAAGAPIPSVAVDGIFGRSTESAVIAAQREGGLIPNGIVGAPTWSYIAQLGR
jgi:peptidoglycan hydrolase-like protein with peptidoglycan-binding domain